MKIVVSHPTGNAFVRAATLRLAETDMLLRFHTAIATFPGSILDRLSAWGPLSELSRRRFHESLRPVTSMLPWRELGRFASYKTGFTRLVAHETGLFCVDAVYQSLDKKVAYRLKHAMEQRADAVYAYEDGALYSFRQAKSIGLQCLYDLPIGYWQSARSLMEIERERWPEWFSTLTGFNDSLEKLARKDEEIRLADRIFVASQFTARTLRDFPGTLAPIEVIPYGFPPVSAPRSYPATSRTKQLRILFVGGLSQRKGIADLFAVADRLGPRVALTVVGNKATGNCAALNAALAKHRWIPTLPHEKVLELMRQHDVLIFPSLFEGFGLVITESMSQGTPVITTDRTAGPDLIKHGENGWLVQAGSTEALQAAVEELLYQPRVIAEVGREAMATARKRPWEIYGRELVAAIERHLYTKSLKGKEIVSA